MKVSSSSFLVAHKLANANINELEVPEEVKIVYESFIDSYFCNTISEIEDIEQYMIDTYGYTNLEEAINFDRERVTKIYNLFKKKLEEGYSISEFWYEDGDTVGPSIIEKLVISGYAEILENI